MAQGYGHTHTHTYPHMAIHTSACPEILPYPTPSFHSAFQLEDLLGEGTYGSVWRCARLAKGAGAPAHPPAPTPALAPALAPALVPACDASLCTPAVRDGQIGAPGAEQQGTPFELHPYEAPGQDQQSQQQQQHQQQQHPLQHWQQQQQHLEHHQHLYLHPQQQQQQQQQWQQQDEGEAGPAQRWYACKVVQKSKLTTKSKREDLRREVALLKLFAGQHPSIVQLHSVYESPSSVKLVMEYCPGGDLFDLLCAHGRLPEPAARHVFRQVASAVAYCHSSGVLHRDIKPENILFDQNAECLYDMTATPGSGANGVCGVGGGERKRGNQAGAQVRKGEVQATQAGAQVRAKLADFGLSVIIGPRGVASGYTGSRFYTAPEMVRGWTYGMRADVWSLGVVLFTMLTGRLPFAGRDDGDVEGTRRAILKGIIDYDQPAWEGVSLSAKDLVRSMLQVDPMKRFHAHEVLAHPWLTGGARAIPKVPVAAPVYGGAGAGAGAGRSAGVLSLAPMPGAQGVRDATGVPPAAALAAAYGMPEAWGAHGVCGALGKPGGLPSGVPSGMPGFVPGAPGVPGVAGVPGLLGVPGVPGGIPGVPGGVPGVYQGESWVQPWQLMLECSSSRESDSSCISQSTTTDAGSPSPGPDEGGTPTGTGTGTPAAYRRRPAPFPDSPLPGPSAACAPAVPRGAATCKSPLPAPAAAEGCGREGERPGEEHEEECGSGEGEEEYDEEEWYEEEEYGEEEGFGGDLGPGVYELYKVQEGEEGEEEEEVEEGEEGSEEMSEGGSEEVQHEGAAAAGFPGLVPAGVLSTCAENQAQAQAHGQTLAEAEARAQGQTQVQAQAQEREGEGHESRVWDTKGRPGAASSTVRPGDTHTSSPQKEAESGREPPQSQHQDLALEELQKKEGRARSGKVKAEKSDKKSVKGDTGDKTGKAKKKHAQCLTQAGATQAGPRPAFKSGEKLQQQQPSTGGEARQQKRQLRSVLQSRAGAAPAQPGSGNREAQSRIVDSQPQVGHTQTRRHLTGWFRLGQKEGGEKKATKGKRLG